MTTPKCNSCGSSMHKVAYLLPGEGDELCHEDVVLYWRCSECLHGEDIDIPGWPFNGTVSIASLIRAGYEVIS